jgi:hypothetical protein
MEFTNPLKIVIMKRITLLGLLGLLLLLVTPDAFAQADVYKNYNVEIQIVKKDSVGEITKTFLDVSDAIEKIVVTPVGNAIRIVSIHLDKSDDFLNYSVQFAIISVSLTADLDGDGEPETTLQDKRAIITSGGVVQLVYHVNKGKS